MRINGNQTTNLYNINSFNQNLTGAQTKNIQNRSQLMRKDRALISPIGRASSAIQNLLNRTNIMKNDGAADGAGNESGIYQNLLTVSVQEADQVHAEETKDKQYSYRFDNKNWDELRTEEVRNSFGSNTYIDEEYSDILSKCDFMQGSIYGELKQIDMANQDQIFARKEYESMNETEFSAYVADVYTKSLTDAYQTVYNKIVQGYQDGTREVWTQDFEEGADYVEYEFNGKKQRFHKLTMEEELARLDEAFARAAKESEDDANRAIKLDRQLKEAMKEMNELWERAGRQRARFEGIEIEERKEAMLEDLKERLEQTEESQQPQKVEIFEILMSERRNWLSQIRTA